MSLRPFLEYYWLRPETAVWRALDCTALQWAEFHEPMLDLGCGDGVFSFLRAGVRFASDHDAFRQVGNLDAFFGGADIYDSFDPDAARPAIKKQPRYRFAAGFDHKPALLQKAAMLGLYDKLIAGDAGKQLPFADSTFATVFSNMVYWLEGYERALCEIASVLKPDGRAYLHLPSDTFRDYSFYQRLFVRTGDEMWKWLTLIDRGRSDNIKNCHRLEDWQSIFRDAGLRIASSRRYLSKLTLEAWDIGLRPISPVLIEMANNLSPQHRQDAKNKMVLTLLPMLEPLCAIDATMTDPAPGFFLFELAKV